MISGRICPFHHHEVYMRSEARDLARMPGSVAWTGRYPASTMSHQQARARGFGMRVPDELFLDSISDCVLDTHILQFMYIPGQAIVDL